MSASRSSQSRRRIATQLGLALALASESVITTARPAPAAVHAQAATVTSPTITATVKSGKVTVRWSKVSGASKYQILRDDKLVATVSSTSWTATVGGSSVRIAVRAVSKLAELSSPSNVLVVSATGAVAETTTAAPTTAAPTIAPAASSQPAATGPKVPAKATESATSAVEPIQPVGTPRLPVAVVDGSGANVGIDSIDRVVVLGGDASEVMYSLGLNDRVVGNDLSSIFPAAVASKPKVGIFSNFSAEGVLRLKPTLVIAHPNSGPPAAIAAVKAAGIPWFVVPETNVLAASTVKIRAIGRAVGMPDDGNRLADSVSSQLAAAKASAAKITKAPVVAYMTYRNNTPYLFGRDSPACVLMTTAGAVCAGTKAGIFDLVVPITAEALIPTKPDIIIAPVDAVAAMGGLDAFKALPGVAQTPASKNGLIFTYDVNFTQGLGPRTGKAVAEFNRLFASLS